MIIGEIENGYVTPERQADYLSKHGHLEGIIGNVSIYTFRGAGFKVIHVGGQVAQIIRIPEADAKMLVKCSELKFGGF